jgi:hypothetical protein
MAPGHRGESVSVGKPTEHGPLGLIFADVTLTDMR